MNLTTLEKVTTRLSKGYEAHLPLLNQLIEEVSLFVEGYLDRQCQTATKTETFDVEESQRIIRLTAWPVTSITSVSNDRTRAFTNYASSSDYAYDTRGLLKFDYSLTPGPQVLRVIYVGGMASTTAAFVAAYPDIAGAVAMQVAYAFMRRTDLGGVSWNAPGGVGASSIGEYDLLENVAAILEPHRATTWA